MASDAVMEFTDDNFATEVEGAEVPVLVDFWAEWCMPCRMLTPVIEELAGEMQGKARVGKLDTDANRNVAAKYGVQAIPTVMLFHGGEVVQKFVGVNPKQDYVDAIEQVVAG